MKISILVSIARQVEGEYCFVNAIKASTSVEKLYRYLSENQLPKTAEISGVSCVVEYGVLTDLEVDD